MKIISGDIIETAAEPHLWIDAMEIALQTFKTADYHTPDRLHVDMADNTLLVMPSVGPDLFSTKLASIFPSNKDKNLPAIQGTLLLNDGATGEALALFNGAKLTAMRTAAVACVGIRHLSDPMTQFMGVIGAGVQGQHLAWMASHERDLERIYFYDPSHQKVVEFMQFMHKHAPHVEVAPCEDEQQVITNSEIVCTATTSKLPVIPNLEDLLLGKTFICIGSYKPDMREIPESVYRLIDTVWIDADQARLESGDLIEPIENAWIKPEQIKHISSLIQTPNELGFKETRLFKSVGHGVFDLFAAKLIYQMAEEKGLGENINL
nr:ornithine cyclodeaminase family protein [uncultured Carboxylicivirga sp.]